MRLLTIVDAHTLVLHDSSLNAAELVRAVHGRDPCLHLPDVPYGWQALQLGDMVIALPAAEGGQVPQPGLTPRQEAALAGLLDGLSTKQIAYNLDVSVNTARKYIKQVQEKLGVATREEVILRILRQAGSLPCDEDQG